MQEGITIEWTANGLVKKVNFGATQRAAGKHNLKYIYDPLGRRSVKMEYLNDAHSSIKYTYYSYDAVGNTIAIYNRTTAQISASGVRKFSDKLLLAEQVLYGSDRLGTDNHNLLLVDAGISQPLANPADLETGTGFSWSGITPLTYDLSSRILGRKNYELSNQLGSVLAVITDRKIKLGTLYSADVISFSDYEPYGAWLQHRHGTETSALYRYGFNGMESDEEIKGESNSYDFDVRNIYDARLGRFISVDPDVRNLPGFSPYQYARNCPIFLKENGNDGVIPAWLWQSGRINPMTAGFIDALADDVKGVFKLAQLYAAYNPAEFFYQTPMAQQIRNETYSQVSNMLTVMSNPILKQMALEKMLGEFGGKVANMTSQEFQYALGYAGFQVLTFLGGVAEAKMLMETGRLSTTLVKSLDEITIVAEKAVAKKADDLAAKLKPPCGCFTAETPVLTAEGYKAIHLIEVGDSVWAYNDTTQVSAWKEVIGIFTTERDALYKIHLGEQLIETTSDHPFYVSGEWINAENLKVGDKLTTFSGIEQLISSIEIVPGDYTVYNFTVADFHTYYVSAYGVLVHNGIPCNWKQEKIFGHAFTRHGSGKKMTTSLTGRIEAKGPQGQWLDNEKVAEFIMQEENYQKIVNLDPRESITIPIPDGLGVVLKKVDGKVISEPATEMIIVRGRNNLIKTAYPKN